MKLSSLSLLLLFGVLYQNALSGADLKEDLIDLCHKSISSDFHSRTLKEIKDTLNPDEKFQPALKDLAKLCDHLKNISHPSQLLEPYSLVDSILPTLMTMLPLGEIMQRLSKTNKYCQTELSAFAVSLLNPGGWSLKILDSAGKLPSGILKGATHWVGDFDQCTGINEPLAPGNVSETNPLVRGQYCTLHVAVPEFLKKKVIPANLSSDLKYIANSLEVKWDFCSTQHCKNTDFKYIFKPIFDLLNNTIKIEVTDLTCHEPVQVFEDKTAIGTTALIGVICAFLLIGTLYDLILCCTTGSQFEYDEETSITGDSYVNNAYEMDITTFELRTHSGNNGRNDYDIINNTQVTVQSAEDKISHYSSSSSRRKTAPAAKVAPADPADPADPATPAASAASAASAAPAPPAPPVAPVQLLAKREAPIPPTTPPPAYPSQDSDSVLHLNTNQNANNLNINGYIPKANSMTKDDILKDKTSSGRGFGTFLLAFSVRRNAYRLLNTEHPVEMLSCLNGMRFLSMAWIILAQTYKISSEDYIKNRIDGIETHQSFTFQAVLAAPFAVDTFFLLSGILLTYFFLENYYSKGNIGIKTVFQIYVRRIIRITPCYAVILLFYTYLLPNLVDGPYWKRDFSQTCRSRLWANLLYINNVFEIKDECMSWTWYLANDMQFFLVSPIILCQFILLPSFAVLTIILMFGAYIVSSVILMQRFLDTTTHEITYDDIYTKPWCRISPFLIGLVLGFYLQQKCRKRSLPKIFQICGWIIASSSCVFLCYIKYTLDRKENPVTWLNSQTTAYEVVSHPLWAMAISWVIIVCATGNGGIVSDILSWKFWIILGRLTYVAFLIHPIVIMVAMRTAMAPYYLSIPTTIYAFIGHLITSYGLAFIVSILFEMPFRMMEKVMSNRK